MSMNLYCKGFDLRQTPTQITYMCCVQPDGTIHGDMKGKKAIHALQIYKQWIQGSLNRLWHSDEEYELAKESVKEHLRELDAFMKEKGRKINVYIL